MKDPINYQSVYTTKVVWEGQLFQLQFHFISGSMTSTSVSCYLVKDVTEEEVPDVSIEDLKDLIKASIKTHLSEISEDHRKHIVSKVVEEEEEDLREDREGKILWVKPFEINVSHVDKYHFKVDYYRYIHVWLNRWEEVQKKQAVVN